MTVSWTRRKFLATAGLAAAVRPAAALAQDKPKSLVCGTYGGDWAQWMKAAFADPFTRATGVAIVQDVGVNMARFAKLKAQKDNPKVHLADFQDRYLHMAAREGLLEELDYARMPNARGVSELHRRRHWVGYMYSSVGIVYNTKALDRPPRRWEDLLDDRLRGKFFVDDFSHFGLHALIAISLAHGGSYDNLDPGFKLFRQFKERLSPRFITTSPEGMKLLASGEAIAAIWQDARVRLLNRQGYPVAYVTPETGDVAVTYGHGIIRGSGYREWAEKFVEVTTDPKRQVAFIEKSIPVTPTHPRAVTAPEIASLIARPPGAKEFALDYDQVLPRLDEWSQRWNKEIAS